MKRLFLTGASGFLGKALLAEFSASHRVIAHSMRRDLPGGVRADLRDETEVARIPREHPCDILVHGAAYRDPDECETHPAEAARLNRDAVGFLAHHLPAESTLVFISTDYVFSGLHPPYVEESPTDPVNVYGRLKAEAEVLALRHANALVLRIPVLVGADPDPAVPGFVRQMVGAVLSGKPQVVDHVLVRHPVWTADVARNLAWLLAEGKRGIWHVGPQGGGTRYELTLQVAQALRKSSLHLQPSTEVVPRPAPRPLNSRLSPAKLLAAGGPGCLEWNDLLPHLLSP